MTSHVLEDVFGTPLLHKQVGDTELIVIQLAYHVALLVNPTADGGYDERYCIHSVEVAGKAIEHFARSGEIWFWQKHHNKRLRVVGRYLYPDNVLCVPENAIRQMPWDADQISRLGVRAFEQQKPTS